MYMMRPLRVLSGLVVAAFTVGGCGDGATATVPVTAPAALPATAVETSPRGPTVVVTPVGGGKHDRYAITITSRRATGVFGKTRHAYTAQAHAVRPASGCVNSRDARFAYGRAGSRLRTTLDPLQGEGGPEGWCVGRFRGTVTYREAFACPPTGTCHAPRGLPTRTNIVGRFSFEVRR